MSDGIKCVMTFTKEWSDEETHEKMNALLESLEALGVKATIKVNGGDEVIFNRSTTATLLATIPQPTEPEGEK